MKLINHRALGAVLGFATLVGGAPAAWADSEPLDIKKVNAVLGKIKDKILPEYEAHVESAVFRFNPETFDLETMTLETETAATFKKTPWDEKDPTTANLDLSFFPLVYNEQPTYAAALKAGLQTSTLNAVKFGAKMSLKFAPPVEDRSEEDHVLYAYLVDVMEAKSLELAIDRTVDFYELLTTAAEGELEGLKQYLSGLEVFDAQESSLRLEYSDQFFNIDLKVQIVVNEANISGEVKFIDPTSEFKDEIEGYRSEVHDALLGVQNRKYDEDIEIAARELIEVLKDFSGL